MSATTQGRCKRCNVAYRWPTHRRTPLTVMHCPECGGPLSQTTNLLKSAPWRTLAQAEAIAVATPVSKLFERRMESWRKELDTRMADYAEEIIHPNWSGEQLAERNARVERERLDRVAWAGKELANHGNRLLRELAYEARLAKKATKG